MSASKSQRRSVSRLEDHVGYWLRFVSNHVSASFARRLEKPDISVSEWVALRKLYDAPIWTSPSALAEALGMNRGAVSRLVERLVQKDLVERQASRDDGRARQIRLSSVGQKLVPRLAAIADANDEAFFGDLSANTRAALIALMRRIAEDSELTKIPVD
ncbi:MAG: MarR family winged helix-turn-helix transcriptional regulator [Acidobacteriaceae bacterium]